MSQLNEVTSARETAQSALAVMAERNIPPTPENFLVWFTQLARGPAHAAPRSMPHSARGRRQLSDSGDVEAVGSRFDSDLMEIGARVEAAVAALIANVGMAGADARQYGAALGSLAGELSPDAGVSVLRRAVTGVLAETQQMLEKTRVLERRLSQSGNEIRALRGQIESARREAMTDPLTGIANRKAFDRQLRLAAREAARHGGELCLLMIDIDFFKRFNDTYGHCLGDQVLRLVAKTLVENVKGRDFVARYGGEEFAVILPDTRLADAVTLADQLRLAVGRKRIVKKATSEDLGAITLSAGVALFIAGEQNAALIGRADAALYAAKNAGRNRVASEEDAEIGDAPLSSWPRPTD